MRRGKSRQNAVTLKPKYLRIFLRREKRKLTFASSTPLTSLNFVLPSIWGLISGFEMMPFPSPFSSRIVPSPLMTTNMIVKVLNVRQSWDFKVGSACIVYKGLLADPISDDPFAPTVPQAFAFRLSKDLEPRLIENTMRPEMMTSGYNECSFFSDWHSNFSVILNLCILVISGMIALLCSFASPHFFGVDLAISIAQKSKCEDTELCVIPRTHERWSALSRLYDEISSIYNPGLFKNINMVRRQVISQPKIRRMGVPVSRRIIWLEKDSSSAGCILELDSAKVPIPAFWYAGPEFCVVCCTPLCIIHNR